MATYYKYTANSSDSLSSDIWNNPDSVFGTVMGPCVVTNNGYFYDYDYNDQVSYSCVYDGEGSQCGSFGFVPYTAGTEFYCQNKPTYYAFSNFTYDGEYKLSFPSGSTWFKSSNLKSSKVYITSEQTSTMGTSLVNAGSGLLHIGIQIIPYAIAFTIILIIFGLIKNWSRLKTDRQLKQIHKRQTKRERKEIKSYGKK